ncbi:hypothetical protein BGZ95_007585 [Linnemannia exigua]|uniref:Uncharacterized protein n=1 Tax=Linnemannia exigua TaxID=604196 RepID=A0AAD4H8X7_9FUNG|nr:hypothetical protein BGZ95_007585 [Linnemannia exigua]
MVSLVLLILAPVVLAALILGGALLFSPKHKVNTKPNIPKLNTTITSLIPSPPSSIIFTTPTLSEKEKVIPPSPIDFIANPSVTITTPLVPAVTTSKAALSPIATLSNVAIFKDITTAKVVDTAPAVTVITSKVLETVKTTEVVTSKVVATSKAPEAVTTKASEDTSTKVVPNPVTATKILGVTLPPNIDPTKLTPVPTLVVPSPSPTASKDKKTGGDDESEDEEQDEKEDDEEDEFEDEEEEEDESPNINGTTGIQARESKEGFKQSAFRMKRFASLKQVASVTDNNDKATVIDGLTERLDKIVEEQSAPFEAELERIMSELLDGQAATVYSDVLQHIETRRLQQQQEQQKVQEPAVTKDKDDITTNAQKSFHAQDGPPAIDTHALLTTLLQPFIIQFRADVRNTVIFICGGQQDGLIDGEINGSDDYAKKAAQEDIIATTHLDGVHITDLYDPQTGALALECLKTRFGHLTTALGKLLAARLAGLKEFLLSKVAALVGIPRFLIPFSEDGETKQEFAEQSVVDALSEEKKERIQRSEAFARWLVNSMVSEFQLAVEQAQDFNVNDGSGSDSSGDAGSNVAVADLPDNDDTNNDDTNNNNNNTNNENENDEMAQSEVGSYQRKEKEEKEKISRSPQVAAREPSRPRIRSRRSTNKKI